MLRRELFALLVKAGAAVGGLMVRVVRVDRRSQTIEVSIVVVPDETKLVLEASEPETLDKAERLLGHSEVFPIQVKDNEAKGGGLRARVKRVIWTLR